MAHEETALSFVVTCILTKLNFTYIVEESVWKSILRDTKNTRKIVLRVKKQKSYNEIRFLSVWGISYALHV